MRVIYRESKSDELVDFNDSSEMKFKIIKPSDIKYRAQASAFVKSQGVTTAG